MSVENLVRLVHGSREGTWTEGNRLCFDSLFGEPGGRYPKTGRKQLELRAPEMNPDSGVPFAAYIHPSNAKSGAYSGLSFAIFPVDARPCLVTLVIGTAGLSPDEAVLGRAGHARKVQAICEWLNREFGQGEQVAWAKHDPTRTDIEIPVELRTRWSEYKPVFDRYGTVIYGLFRPGTDTRATQAAIAAFLDLVLQERGYSPIAKYKRESEDYQSRYLDYLMPSAGLDDVRELLESRRFVILQGPPGTGKTRMCQLLRDAYGGFGKTVQFHANTTYENFVGGLAPIHSHNDVGLQFAPKAGFLMEAAAEALTNPLRPYLFHIDEINRADLGKVLGEALYLLEIDGTKRAIDLPYYFGEPFGRALYLPDNLQIVGTMNSADRSIAIVDVAVRRRFAFLSLWPQASVVKHYGGEIMQDAYQRLNSIFVEHATEDSLQLVPGHSYFLEKDDIRAKRSLNTSLAPLLDEYLAQGYVSAFSEQIRNYLQWLRSL
ncbi:MAG TPA: AAA family ATPase [Bryobacteraceae bacterium]|nr:AAA family ATPase [Bryobacteraceae bacterium]